MEDISGYIVRNITRKNDVYSYKIGNKKYANRTEDRLLHHLQRVIERFLRDFNIRKIYVGQASGHDNLEHRRSAHRREKYFNFTHICTCQSKTLLNELERYVIAYLSVKRGDLLRNKSGGGEGPHQTTIESPTRYVYLCTN